MKNFKLAFAAAALLAVAAPYAAQAQSTYDDQQQLIAQVQADKRAVFAQNLQLTEAEGRAFWPVYDEYEAKLKKIDDQFLALVDSYAAKFGAITDADAADMLKQKMSLEKQREDLKQTYTKKVAKVLPPIKALRYAQVETRVTNMIRNDVYSLIPIAQ